MTKQLTISILCEDQARMGFRDQIFLAQHGLSIFIEEDRQILFDTGASDIFLQNASLFGIDVESADWIVLSHGHWDHADGLMALESGKSPKARLLVHPGVFVDRRKATGEFNGMALGREETAEKFDLVQSEKPYQLTDHTWFLGEIPRDNDFESQTTAFYFMDQGKKHPDFLLDDTALTIRTPQGLVIVTGCSHAGICNIVEHAKATTRENRVHAVIGGFHLLGNPEQTEKTIAYFEKNRVEYLFPMHCTDLASLAAFHRVFGSKKLCTGDRLVFALA